MTMPPWHDHGPAFKGCSLERHRLLVEGRPATEGEAPESSEERWARLKRFSILVDGVWRCLCCREELAGVPLFVEFAVV